MTAGSTIFWNVVATYGRSVFALGCGLFSARWILQALGHEDFGLYGVVGSIIVFITFFNGVLGTSVARFYAFVIGKGSSLDGHESIELMKKWFNTAFALHSIIPFCLIVLGYPIGVYAIEHWLTIPEGRMWACIVVFRISLVTAFVSMASIPFIALYTAHQNIAELSLWGFLSSSLVFVSAYCLLFIPTDRLVAYSLIMASIHIGIPLCQIVRAGFKYRECRFKISYLWDRSRALQLLGFSGWQFFGNCGSLMRGQACTMLTNVYFGPKVNAAYSVSGQVLSHTSTLAQAMIGAFTPAITTAEGEGNRERMLSLAWKTSRLGTYLILLFLIPLILEIDSVLQLWLGDPPQWTATLCMASIIEIVFTKMTVGQQLAIAAQGKIARYQASVGMIMMAAFPIAWVAVKMGCGPMSVVIGLIVSTIAASLGRVYFGWRQLEMQPAQWLRKVVAPILCYLLITSAVGCLPRLFVNAGIFRVFMTTLFTLFCAGFLGWFMILESEERKVVKSVVLRFL